MNKLTPELRKASQPPLSHAGAPAEADRAKRPSLVQPSAPQAELNPGDRVEGLGNFGMPTGQLGTVERANEEDANETAPTVAQKVGKKAHPHAKSASA
jgi:hypothetical protein